MSADASKSQSATLPPLATLQEREAQLDDLELELALEDAQLRGQEGQLAAQRQALTERAARLDQRERQLIERAGPLLQRDRLAGLGDGQALGDSDVEGLVAKSLTLHLGREALLVARHEMLQRRRQLQAQRRNELLDYEAGFGRAELRLAARERLVAKATAELLRDLADTTLPRSTPPVARSRRSPTPTPSQLPQVPHGTLSLHGIPVARSQIEYDRDGATLLISFPTALPNLPEKAELLWRGESGSERRFAVRVRRVMASPTGGAAAVLHPYEWSASDRDALAVLLLRLA
ncbi:MAG: hypothetical protein HY902_12260 [Deltaproteobacteria bacterium]|nr:hypothetical protein [Deltaproteobacteria bacterium]